MLYPFGMVDCEKPENVQDFEHLEKQNIGIPYKFTGNTHLNYKSKIPMSSHIILTPGHKSLDPIMYN